jgi:hypothetical protein
MTCFICATCATQFADAPSPPERCPICADPRQYVPEEGQRWTTAAALAEDHRIELREDDELLGIGIEPAFAIGQRALLVPCGARNLLWDCTPLVDDATARAIEARGGLAAIAISHPHYYSGMVDWAHRLGCPIYLHAADERWIMRPDPAIELWDGDTKELDGGLTLVRCGGHFEGGTVLHWPAGAGGRGALLSGDIVQVIPDRAHVSFMYSYPNLIPLPEHEVRRIAARLEPLAFERIYGAWWGRIVRREGRRVVLRSAERYVRALRGELPGGGQDSSPG